MKNEGAKSVWDYYSQSSGRLNNFRLIQTTAGQKWNVYSAPDFFAWRGANGKAMVNTNGDVYAAGWEGDWLLVMYETNNGSVRVGYVNGSDIRGNISEDRMLGFAYSPATMLAHATMTDDPARGGAMTALDQSTKVTYLATYKHISGSGWDYIETTVNGQIARGFIPTGCLDVTKQSYQMEGNTHE